MILINLSQDASKISQYISHSLLKCLEEQIAEKRKSILYMNKRGEFSSLVCTQCHHIYKCKHCDVALTLHKYPEKLLCHVCGYDENVPQKCDTCQHNSLKKIGIGTQQIEDLLSKYFPDKKIFRFDTDTIRNKQEKENALSQIENADIIIGTKMITTGLNIKNLGLIGIILIEQELCIPKYNTEERFYSNITQLIGRGGRNGENTHILIQTFIPENNIIKTITQDNYKTFFRNTLSERKLFSYPPYCELVTLEYRDNNEQKAVDFMLNLKNKLQQEKGEIFESVELIFNPRHQKKYNQYHVNLLVKGNNIREFLECIRPEILRNGKLSIRFE